MTTEDRWTELAEKVICGFENEQCPFEDFVRGLEILQDAVSERLSAARSELVAMEEDNAPVNHDTQGSEDVEGVSSDE